MIHFALGVIVGLLLAGLLYAFEQRWNVRPYEEIKRIARTEEPVFIPSAPGEVLDHTNDHEEIVRQIVGDSEEV